jgi:hypothetical protein
MPLGENYCTRRSKNRAECSKPTPRFITTVSGMHFLPSNNAFAAIYSLAHSTPITDGSNGNGKSAKGRKESPFACQLPFKRAAQTDSVQDETVEPQTRYAFRFRSYWFVLAQTEGEGTCTAPIPGFDIDTALQTLNITRTLFEEMNGNIQGFANGREIAVNPVAALPHKTTFHEIAHLSSGTPNRKSSWIANRPPSISARSRPNLSR